MKPDLVIRGGQVVDGSGGPAREADVVIAADRIVGIGKYDGRSSREIDARGMVVTPGFVDVHTHLDAQLTWDPYGLPSVLHGVTSAVVGNCGVGFAPCRPHDRDYLMFLMEGVEDIPQAALRAGLRWDWETFPEYLEALGRRPLALNVGAHVSHAPLRVYVMGARGASDAAASEEELAQMHRVLLEALRAGALGVATGRTTMHRTPAWDPVPGTFADRRELDVLAAALRDAGRGLLQLVPYGGGGEDAGGFAREYEWMLPIGRESGRPLSVALTQPLAYPTAWRDALRMVEEANAVGVTILPQVPVRCVGIVLGLGTAVSPLALFPAAGDLLGKPAEELRTILREPAVRARLLESIAATDGTILGGMARLENVFPLEALGVRAYETTPERSIVAIGKRDGRHAGEVMLDLLLQQDFRCFFLLPLYNADLDATAALLEHPLTTIGLGDAGAHTTQTSDAGFPTFLLAYWVRERRRFTLPQAVKMITSDLAGLWGIGDRGVLRAGAYADLNVIDLAALDLLLPELRHDLPGGAPNLSQGARGYRATIVNGSVVMEDGEPTGALPGQVLRGGRQAGA
jgi:N-acyl-D-aspartate/D-glutamate deacylase